MFMAFAQQTDVINLARRRAYLEPTAASTDTKFERRRELAQSPELGKSLEGLEVTLGLFWCYIGIKERKWKPV